MQIVQAKISDLETLQKLFGAYREFYHHPSEVNKELEFLRDRISKEESIVYLIYSENEAAGFVQLYPIFSSVKMKRVWLLNDLFIHQAHRGKGLGLALIEHAKKLCAQSNARGLVLETEIGNEIGNQLYPKAGFSLSNDNHYYWELKS